MSLVFPAPKSWSASFGVLCKGVERKSDEILAGQSVCNSQRKSHGKDSDAGTVYNFDTIDVDGKPEAQFKC